MAESGESVDEKMSSNLNGTCLNHKVNNMNEKYFMLV